MIEISGIIGISILKKKNKFFIIIYDDHSNTNYCNNKLFYISNLLEFLENKLKNIVFFIEDYNENNDKYFIWDKNITHLTKLNNFLSNKKNNKNWIFTDIRLYFEKNLYDNLKYIFDLTDKNDNPKLIELKKEINKFIKIDYLKKFFENLKKKFVSLNIKHKNNKLIFNYFFKGYLINDYNINDYDYELDLILENLMEFYTICKVNFNKNKINIFNYGLLHSINFAYYLKLSGCEIIYENGITESDFDNITDLDKLENDVKSCVYI